ncbi:MAG: NTP transferase domain-containing protein [Acidobacteria bacterium]|nr:NTP transferase domain-containing protein [Acidobacteriota bacterium]
MSLPVAILAGGLGTRLGGLTQSMPKAMAPVNGKPFIAHQLRLLARNGITRVVLCLSYLAEQVREYVGDGAQFGLGVQYALDGPRLLGTAGAVANALPLLGPEFFVLYGDSYLPCDYGAVEHAFRSSGKLALMTVYRNEGRFDTSNVELDSGRILAYDKKQRTPRMQHIDYGLGAFNARAFDGSGGDGAHDLAELYRDLLQRGELAAFEVPQRFYEIGSPQGLHELSEHLAQRS